MVGPTKLNSILIQRLDTMLGGNVGQQSSIGPADSPRVVYQPGNPENISALKNPPQQELINKDLGQTKQRHADKSDTGKSLRQMDLNSLFGREHTQKSATRSAPTTLGYAARIILALFNKFPESNRTIKGQIPLLPDPKQAESSKQNMPLTNRVIGQSTNTSTLLANLLANNMAHSIKNSGLFYESHLAKLTKGETTAKELLLQPQNNQSTNPNEQLQSLVRQQLEVLANQSLIWRGEAWPGAEIECEIKRHTDENTSDESQDSDGTKSSDQETKRWSSRLNLTLPKLGAITVNLDLHAKNLNIHIRASESGDQLKQSRNLLFNQLIARGLHSQQILIENDQPNNIAKSPATGADNG